MNSTFIEIECPVCLCDIKDSIATLDGCQHQFCLSCISRWITSKSTCPMDRTQISNISVRSDEGIEYSMSPNEIQNNYILSVAKEGQCLIEETRNAIQGQDDVIDSMRLFIFERVNIINQVIYQTSRIKDKMMILKSTCRKSIGNCLLECRKIVSKELISCMKEVYKSRDFYNQYVKINSKLINYIMKIENIAVNEEINIMGDVYSSCEYLSDAASIIYNLWFSIKSIMKDILVVYQIFYTFLRPNKFDNDSVQRIDEHCRVLWNMKKFMLETTDLISKAVVCVNELLRRY